MSIGIVLFAGVAVVLVGVLLVRLHAMVALLLAAALVASLTPLSWRLRTEVLARALKWQPRQAGDATGSNAASSSEIVQAPSDQATGQQSGLNATWDFRVEADASGRTTPGQSLWLVRFSEQPEGEIVAFGQLLRSDNPTEAFLGRWTYRASEPRPNDVLVTPADWDACQKAARRSIGQRLGRAFGDTCAEIAILIAMAAIIGRALFDSGAADMIVRRFLGWFGERRAAWAFWGSGFLLGIPVFFDTVFYLMMPLGKALRLRTGKDLLLYTLAIVSGATMAHSLVPPTPGPLFVARQLRVDLAVMIVAGTVIGLVAAAAGLLFAMRANRRYELPLRDTPGFPLDELRRMADSDDARLPPFGWAVLPIVLPVVLISARAAQESLNWSLPPLAHAALQTLGEQNMALVLAAAVAVGLVVRRGVSLRAWAPAMQSAITGAGTIILITAAGGTFGAMIRQTGIAHVIQVPSGASLVWLVLAFLVTAAIRTAQGSATVAMITSVGIFAGFASPQVLGFHPVYLALAIGCGSKPLAWMNDSGFWVICQMSGMTEREALRFVTPMSLIMGTVGLAATMLAAWLFPLAG